MKRKIVIIILGLMLALGSGFLIACVDRGNGPITVTFNTLGGSTINSQTISQNSTATRPTTDPIRTNYTFVNWFTSETGGTEFNFATPIASNTTIYARWQSDTQLINLSEATIILSGTEVRFTGNPQTPSVVSVTVGGVVVHNTNFSVSYSNNINPGTASVTVAAVGIGFTGTATTTFSIVQISNTNLADSQFTRVDVVENFNSASSFDDAGWNLGTEISFVNEPGHTGSFRVHTINSIGERMSSGRFIWKEIELYENETLSIEFWGQRSGGSRTFCVRLSDDGGENWITGYTAPASSSWVRHTAQINGGIVQGVNRNLRLAIFTNRTSNVSSSTGRIDDISYTITGNAPSFLQGESLNLTHSVVGAIETRNVEYQIVTSGTTAIGVQVAGNTLTAASGGIVKLRAVFNSIESLPFWVLVKSYVVHDLSNPVLNLQRTFEITRYMGRVRLVGSFDLNSSAIEGVRINILDRLSKLDLVFDNIGFSSFAGQSAIVSNSYFELNIIAKGVSEIRGVSTTYSVPAALNLSGTTLNISGEGNINLLGGNFSGVAIWARSVEIDMNGSANIIGGNGRVGANGVRQGTGFTSAQAGGHGGYGITATGTVRILSGTILVAGGNGGVGGNGSSAAGSGNIVGGNRHGGNGGNGGAAIQTSGQVQLLTGMFSGGNGANGGRGGDGNNTGLLGGTFSNGGNGGSGGNGSAALLTSSPAIAVGVEVKRGVGALGGFGGIGHLNPPNFNGPNGSNGIHGI